MIGAHNEPAVQEIIKGRRKGLLIKNGRKSLPSAYSGVPGSASGIVVS